MPATSRRAGLALVVGLSVSTVLLAAGQPAARADQPPSPAAAAREARIKAQLEATPGAVPMLADWSGGLPHFDARYAAGGPAHAARASIANLHASPAWAARRAEAAKLIAAVPELRIDDHDVYATPEFVRSTAEFLTGPSKSAPADIAARFVADHAALFEIDPLEIPAARVERDYRTDHNGLTHLTFQQLVRGLDLFGCELRANVMPDGRLLNIASTMLPRPAGDFVPTDFKLSAADAVGAGAKFSGVTLKAAPVAAGEPKGLTEKTVWRTPDGLRPDEPVVSEKVYFALTREDLRAAYAVTIPVPGAGHTYDLVIDATTGELLYRHDRLVWDSTQPVTMRVYTSDGVAPMSPGLPAPAATQAPVVPRTLLTVNPSDVTAYSPNGWINDGNTETVGNNVDAHLDLDNNNVADTPRPNGGASRVFDFPQDPNLDPSTYRDASVTQLFYRANWYHDRLYAMGFNEAARNFQTTNFTGLGTGNDAVQADCQDSAGLTATSSNRNNANFSTSGTDGSSARVQMYIFTGPTPDRDGSLDGDIVYHELTHGTSIRLHGPNGLNNIQCGGMGEGWSDYFGISLLAEATDDPDANYTTGGYTTYQLFGATFTQNYYFGIRRYPYSTNLAVNPLTLKFIDATQLAYPAGPPRNTSIGATTTVNGVTMGEVHAVGEVWCNTLLECRAALWRRDGFAGNQEMMQLVIDGMKVSPANPTFLQARDAIIQADMADTGGANRVQLWTAFAKRGMGSSATSPASSTTNGVVEAFDLPFRAVFTFPDGLPSQLQPGAAATFRVGITAVGVTLTPDTASITTAVNGVSGPTVALTPTATPNEYTATLPAANCFDRVTFSLSVGTSMGLSTSPATGSYAASVFTAQTSTRFDDFETDTGWTVGPNTASTGLWIRAVPIASAAQPGVNHTPGGTMCWVTGNGTVGGAVGAADVDGGYTTLVSPTLDLSGYADARISYARWYSGGAGSQPYTNTFRVDVSTNNGGSWVNAETLGGNTPDTNPGWRDAAWKLSQFGLTPTSQVKVRFIAEDLTGSVVEAALDDFRVERIECTPPMPTCAPDFNHSGTVSVQDIFDFLSAYFANDPSADFNRSGTVSVQDIFDFLSAYFAGC